MARTASRSASAKAGGADASCSMTSTEAMYAGALAAIPGAAVLAHALRASAASGAVKPAEYR